MNYIYDFFAPFIRSKRKKKRKRKRGRDEDNNKHDDNDNEESGNGRAGDRRSAKKRRHISAPKSSSKLQRDLQVATPVSSDNDDNVDISKKTKINIKNTKKEKNILESCLSKSNDGGPLTSILSTSASSVKSKGINENRSNGFHAHQKNNSSSHDRRVSFGKFNSGFGSSDLKSSPSGGSALFDDTMNTTSDTNGGVFDNSPIANTRLEFDEKRRVGYNNEGLDVLKSSISSVSPSKPEFHKSPEATYALWGNDPTKHNFDKPFNKYEASKKKNNYLNFHLRNNNSSSPYNNNMNANQRYHRQQLYQQEQQQQQQQYYYSHQHDGYYEAMPSHYNHTIYEERNDNNISQQESRDFLAYQELLRQKQKTGQRPLYQTMRSPSGGVINIDEEHDPLYRLNLINSIANRNSYSNTSTPHSSVPHHERGTMAWELEREEADRKRIEQLRVAKSSLRSLREKAKEHNSNDNISIRFGNNNLLPEIKISPRKNVSNLNQDTDVGESYLHGGNQNDNSVNNINGAKTTKVDLPTSSAPISSNLSHKELSKSLFAFTKVNIPGVTDGSTRFGSNSSVTSSRTDVNNSNKHISYGNFDAYMDNTVQEEVESTDNDTKIKLPSNSVSLNKELETPLFSFATTSTNGSSKDQSSMVESNVNNSNKHISYGNFDAYMDNTVQEEVESTDNDTKIKLPSNSVSLNKELETPLFSFATTSTNGSSKDQSSMVESNVNNSNKHISYGNFDAYFPPGGDKINEPIESEEEEGEDHEEDTINSSRPSFEPKIEPGDLARVELAWNRNLDERDVVIDSTKHGKDHKNRDVIYESEVTRKDYKSLVPGSWLSDGIINPYIKVLRNICRINKLKIHWWQTSFFIKVYNNGDFAYNEVKRWGKRRVIGKNIFEMDKMFIPVHKDGSHWILIEACMKSKEIKFYDSMLGALDEKYAFKMMTTIAQYINKEGEQKQIEGLNAMDWKMSIVKNTPQQRNGYDCGVFMLQNGRALMGIIDNVTGIQFNQGNIDYYRYLIGATLIDPEKYAPKSVEHAEEEMTMQV